MEHEFWTKGHELITFRHDDAGSRLYRDGVLVAEATRPAVGSALVAKSDWEAGREDSDGNPLVTRRADELAAAADFMTQGALTSVRIDGRVVRREELAEQFRSLAGLAAPTGALVAIKDEQQDQAIRGPLTDRQRNDIRAYAATLHGGQLGAFDDIISKAAVQGYMNGRQDFAAPTESAAAPPEPPMKARYLVKIRRTDGMLVKPEAEQIDGKEWEFTRGWLIEDENSRYPGEWAMIPSQGQGWPDGAPGWVATGDLVKQPPKADV